MAAADTDRIDRIADILAYVMGKSASPQIAIDAMVKVLAWIVVRNAVDDRVDLLTQDVLTGLRAAIKSAQAYHKRKGLTKPTKRPTPTLN